ncbi:conserved hypothetical protein [Ricinus communis]|uniref:Reverse transcriptase domain-containing protein n=1 Tax=Ricinus communis TaxID=3988 RepID=B9S305_RICCO|nr:conserved hypothetical protein [Ricinus communis]
MESILRYVPNKVTSKMNASLTTPFMAEDICKALFNMHPSKACGKDGVSAIIFKNIVMWCMLMFTYLK